MIISKKLYTVKKADGYREKYVASSINEVVEMYKIAHNTTEDPKMVDLDDDVYVDSDNVDIEENLITENQL